MSDLELKVIMIEGLDAAIIGTGYKEHEEVIVYDYRAAVNILVNSGYDIEEAEGHVEYLATSDTPRAPMFVFTREDSAYQVDKPTGTTLH
jgi:cobyric acid synthase|tara:strand:+ start:1082 stop:1351 length:270 start_codon:yes stop_codon:yes gene_type:complete